MYGHYPPSSDDIYKQCGRRNCEAQQCKQMVAGKHVCDDCLAEFKYLNSKPTVQPRRWWHKQFFEFMETPKLCDNAYTTATLSEFLHQATTPNKE